MHSGVNAASNLYQNLLIAISNHLKLQRFNGEMCAKNDADSNNAVIIQRISVFRKVVER